MGMDYIAVYEGDEQPSGTIKVSLDRVQRSGVRTEPAQARAIVRALRAVGTVAIDERRATIVTMRSDGYVEDLFVNTTGQHVQAGEPLFRVYSPDIQQALSDLLVAKSWAQRGPAESGGGKSVDGAMQRLRNLGLSDNRIREIRDSGTNPRIIDWLAPAGGTVIAKKIVNGQKVIAGDELYRIVDLTNLWVIADVAEGDLAEIKPGMRATVTFRAYRSEPVEGVVTFIYPDVRPETRTVRVRIEVANPDERLKPDMYADVAFQVGTDRATVTAVPTSAIIDTGTKQIVLVAKGEGRFEPRVVKLGRRGDGYVEIVEGLQQAEEVVTTATFLIDAESNLQSALKTFTEQERPK
jgi:Cu(I)/Ag(I) efflux system membrane fusion protein